MIHQTSYINVLILSCQFVLLQKLTDLQRAMNASKAECERLRDRLEDAADVKPCIKCNQKPSFTNGTQTDAQQSALPPAYGSSLIDQVDYETLNNKFRAAKKKIVDQKTQCDELIGRLAELQQNNDKIMAEHQQLNKTHSLVMAKYEKTKQICNSRRGEIDRLQQEVDANVVAINEQKAIISQLQQGLPSQGASGDVSANADLAGKLKATERSLAILTEKYSMVKKICESRRGEIEKLQSKIDTGKENIPHNNGH